MWKRFVNENRVWKKDGNSLIVKTKLQPFQWTVLPLLAVLITIVFYFIPLEELLSMFLFFLVMGILGFLLYVWVYKPSFKIIISKQELVLNRWSGKKHIKLEDIAYFLLRGGSHLGESAYSSIPAQILAITNDKKEIFLMHPPRTDADDKDNLDFLRELGKIRELKVTKSFKYIENLIKPA